MSDTMKPDTPKACPQPDIDICRECGEHAEFNEDGESECCSAGAYDSDPDIDMER